MATASPTARKRAAARRKKPVSRAKPSRSVKIPRSGPLYARLGAWAALRIADQFDDHKSVTMTRRDAAILRITHEGCPTCKGNGQIFTKAKDGSFTGSKPCPAKPTRQKASRMQVAIASRFGADKNSGLVGWTCPCGKKEKPRFRDAKEATKALRTHERQKHGGRSVGGAWYGQVADGAIPAQTPTAPERPQPQPQPRPRPKPKTSAKDQPMPSPDYSDPATPLTAPQYAWSATLAHRRPEQYGLQPSQDCTGSYTPPPGVTVGTFLTGIKTWYAQQHDIPVDEVYLVRCELREK
ncbi:hypothetical protein ABZ508_26675 [Streptomyces lavendulocolor]|uniref:Uncharacterized protein n=1 Tax=Streptomyces lavendulocolor TaxID=67316 RepID=A0ABV2WCA8_9ACTN